MVAGFPGVQVSGLVTNTHAEAIALRSVRAAVVFLRLLVSGTLSGVSGSSGTDCVAPLGMRWCSRIRCSLAEWLIGGRATE